MRIKETCEDFLVNEILDETIISETPTHHHLYILKKRNYTTERAVSHIAKALRIQRKNIAYAGTKDKQAITTQYITITGASKEKVTELTLKDLELSFAGYAKQKITLGDLRGNQFIITVRELTVFPPIMPETFYVPHYFDDQRFSTHNVDIGKHLLKKQYQEAVQLVLATDEDHAAPITQYLATHQNDFIGALRLLPGKTLLFYVHSVQSFLFNKLLAKTIRDGFSVPYSQGLLVFPKQPLTQLTPEQQTKTIPLIGYDSELSSQEETILLEETVTPRDFLIKSLPQLSLAGETRKAYVPVTHFCVLEQHEEQNIIKISFTLPKGAYATIVLKQLFANQEFSV